MKGQNTHKEVITKKVPTTPPQKKTKQQQQKNNNKEKKTRQKHRNIEKVYEISLMWFW